MKNFFFINTLTALFLIHFSALNAGNGRVSERTKWVNGVIPFKIDSSMNAHQHAAVYWAANHVNERSAQTKVKVVEFDRQKHGHHVVFRDWKGTSSAIGMKSKRGFQYINMNVRAVGRSLVHELGHCIGLGHEQNRMDRNQYITIVNPETLAKQTVKPGGRNLGVYDYKSLMHYKGKNYLNPVGGTGNKYGFTENDFKSIEGLYSGKNMAPYGENDVYSIKKGRTLVVKDGIWSDEYQNILHNDGDFNGDNLEIEVVNNVKNGRLNLNNDGSFVYTANSGFSGVDTFSYRLFDGKDYSNDLLVSIKVPRDPNENTNNTNTNGYNGELLNFRSLISIAHQDKTPDNFELSTKRLTLRGNSWKAVELPYAVTKNTVLEFDFESTVEGEFHGVGFAKHLDRSHARKRFDLYGDKSTRRSIKDFKNYRGGVQRYKIRVGDYYTGNHGYLFFIIDDDRPIKQRVANSIFSNVTVYEEE